MNCFLKILYLNKVICI